MLQSSMSIYPSQLESQIIKTASFSEQTMFADKYPSTFSPQMETIVYILLQVFFSNIPQICWGILDHVPRLDQLHASENIWIISTEVYIPKILLI